MLIDFLFHEFRNIFLVVFHPNLQLRTIAESILDVTVWTTGYENHKRSTTRFHHFGKHLDQIFPIVLITFIKSVNDDGRSGKEVQRLGELLLAELPAHGPSITPAILVHLPERRPNMPVPAMTG